MKRRWNSNTWVLIILGGVLLLTGFDVGRRFLVTKDYVVESPANPGFKIGDEAPDFELPDKAGVKHSLSSLVKKDTMLCFLCGCNSCRTMQTYLGKLVKLMGPNAPEVISVTTQNKDFEERYKEITNLSQTLLYEKHGGDVMTEYRGNPCPRLYRLDAQRKLVWIGPSNLDLPSPSAMSMPLATALGFRNEGEPVSSKPLAPKMAFIAPPKPPDANGARGVTPGMPMAPGSSMPPGVTMGPNGMMPAHVPVAPGSSNPPGVDGGLLSSKPGQAEHSAHDGHGH